MNKLWAIPLIFLLAGCGSFGASRNIVPIMNPDMVYLSNTKGVATTKNGISVVAVYLQDVKELDGFGVMIINETPNWISLKKEECMLVQNGQVIYPLDDEKAKARLGMGYKAKMPDGLIADIYQWRRDINLKPLKDTKVVDKDKKISIITGARDNIYLYFNTQGNNAPMQLIIPNIYNENTKERTSFSFGFVLEKK
ncbi:TPA: hypothetical protein ENS27_07730 [bacterium]|nr:hypothetical protein [bacterium]